ncbi:MAG: D-aminoacyl-tRNA deacylase [Desulfobacula sp.]|jgi:D-tyrosyl-tRNA(Tyr) deacylase
MKAVVQRVKHSHVTVADKIVSRIGHGLMVLLGVSEGDTKKDADFLVEKIINLRIFEDDNGKLNISLMDVKGELLVVSQFTLLGDCRKGRRPSYIKAAAPEKANSLYEYFIRRAQEFGVETKSGVFQAMMEVSLINQGPVTLILDTKEKEPKEKDTKEK